MKSLDDEEVENLKEEVEGMVRLGLYQEGKTRPLKVRLKLQKATEEVLKRAPKLREKEDCKEIYIKKNINEEERKKLKEMYVEVDEINHERSEEEKTKFFGEF